jgi:hypothetical protein
MRLSGQPSVFLGIVDLSEGYFGRSPSVWNGQRTVIFPSKRHQGLQS